jgi:twitching motility protein PilT
MSTLIDKLLQTTIVRKASELHITPGEPPVLRVNGRLRRLETQDLDAEDTESMMKDVTPYHNQEELQNTGKTDFEYPLGEIARFRVSVSRQSGSVALVFSVQFALPTPPSRFSFPR